MVSMLIMWGPLRHMVQSSSGKVLLMRGMAPPMAGLRSITWTLTPISVNCDAAVSPAIPAPTMRASCVLSKEMVSVGLTLMAFSMDALRSILAFSVASPLSECTHASCSFAFTMTRFSGSSSEASITASRGFWQTERVHANATIFSEPWETASTRSSFMALVHAASVVIISLTPWVSLAKLLSSSMSRCSARTPPHVQNTTCTLI